MVRYLYNKNAKYMESIGPNSEYDSLNKGETKTRSFFWDKNSKKPTIFTFILLIALTLIFLIWGIVDTIEDFHEIKVVIDYSENFYGSIFFQDTVDSIENGESEYEYQIREGITIYISIYLSERSIPLSIYIFDNGNLVINFTETGSYSPIRLDYFVGE